MSGQLARRQMSVDDLTRYAKAFAASGYFEDARDVAQAFVKISTGHELGIAPMTAMSEIHIIKGKPTLGAGALAALVKAHPAYDYRVVEHTTERCGVEFFAVTATGRESLGVSVFTLEDARTAGLLGNQTWKLYPCNMLFARAISNGVGWYCPDVTMGRVYVPDELGADPSDPVVVEAVQVDPATGEILDDEPEAPSADVVEPADLALWQRADRLTAEALDAGVASPAIAGNRAMNDDAPEEHVRWLEFQLAAVKPQEVSPPPTATPSQKKKLDVLVGHLRDGGHLTTEQLHLAVRGVIAPPDAADGRVHWSPLRESLSKQEASDLIERLSKFETNVSESLFQPPPGVA